MKPTNIFYILFFFLILASGYRSSGQGFVWAHKINGPNYNNNGSSVRVIATDGDNNVYIAGAFNDTIDVDPGPGVMLFPAIGMFDTYIAKIDANGNLIWAKHIAGMDGDSSRCFPYGISVDGAGDIYLGGGYSDSVDFDPGSGIEIMSTPGVTYNAFILKLSTSGDFIWSKSMGSTTCPSNFSITDLTMDAADNIFITCAYSSTSPCAMDADPGPGVHNVTGQIYRSILIAKLDPDANLIWAKEITGNGHQIANAMALDRQNNIYITGQVNGTVDLDPGPGAANFYATQDIFMAKYDSAGNYQWGGTCTGGGNDKGTDIATDTFGNIVVTGDWGGYSIDLDPGPGILNFTSNYSHNNFVLRLRSNGMHTMINSEPGYSNFVALDPYGNIFLTDNNVVQKWDSVGNFLWKKEFQSPQNGTKAQTTSIVIDQENNPLIGGLSYGLTDLDPGPGIYNSYRGGFVVKLCGESLDIAITANDHIICPISDYVEITTPFVTGATYTWYCNGNLVPGINGNVIITSEPGIYDVYIDGVCPSASKQVYIYDCYGQLYNSAEVSIIEKDRSIDVYPNPFNDAITAHGLKANDVVSLVDITGRVLYSRHCAAATETFTINGLAAGYYVLRVVGENGAARANVPVVKK